MGTCLFGSVTCDLQPGTGALVSLVVAIFFVLFGLLLRSEPGT
jgi:hypothetical protein